MKLFIHSTRFWRLGMVCFLFTSCINSDYDLSKGINTDITIGAGGLSIPLGNTEPIKLSQLIKESDMIELEDGFYSLRKKGEIAETKVNIDPVRFALNDLQMTPVRVDFDLPTIAPFRIDDCVQQMTLTPTELDLGNSVYQPIRHQVNVEGPLLPDAAIELPTQLLSVSTSAIECRFEFDVPEEVERVETVYFGSAAGQLVWFKLNVAEVMAAMRPETVRHGLPLFELRFPSCFQLAAASGSPYAAWTRVDGNVLRIENLPLNATSTHIEIPFYIQSATINAPTGKYTYAEPILYQLQYEFSGTTAGKAVTLRLSAVFEEELHFFDAAVSTHRIGFDLPASETKMTARITGLEDIARINSLAFEDTQMRIAVEDIALPLPLSSEGWLEIALPSCFRYELPAITEGVELNGNKVRVTGDKLPGLKLDIRLKGADLAHYPIVGDLLTLNESLLCEGINLGLAPGKARLRDLQSMNGKSLDIELQGNLVEIADAEVVTDRVQTVVETSGTIALDEEVPMELKVVHEVTPQADTRTYLSMALYFPADFPSGVEWVTFENLKIHFPDFVRFKDTRVIDQMMLVNETFRPKEGYKMKLEIERLDFSTFNNGEGLAAVERNGKSWLQIANNNEVRISGTVKTSQAQVGMQELKNIVITPVIAVDEFSIGMVKGYVEPDIEPMQEKLLLEVGDDLAFLKQDAVLNLFNPQFYLHVANTMGVPMELTLNLSGSDADGEVISGSAIAPLKVEVDAATQPGEVTYTRFLISKQGTEKAGYKTVRSEDLSNLLTVLPDAISVDMTGVATRGQLHEVNLSQDAPLSVSGDYEVVVPLRFEAIELNYVESITGLVKELEKYSANQEELTLEIKTTVLNTIPMDLTLTVVGRDAEGNIIQGIVSEKAPIASGLGADKPVETAALVKVVIEKDALPLLEVLDLVIHGQGEETQNGLALRDDQFVQLTGMRLKLLGGVNINIDNL